MSTKTTAKIKSTNATTVIQTRIPMQDRDMAERICAHFGLTLNEAIRLMVKSIVNTNSIPVNLSMTPNERLPDAQELAAIESYLANPELLSKAESQEFLQELRDAI